LAEPACLRSSKCTADAAAVGLSTPVATQARPSRISQSQSSLVIFRGRRLIPLLTMIGDEASLVLALDTLHAERRTLRDEFLVELG
jgi:hypothetical protein